MITTTKHTRTILLVLSIFFLVLSIILIFLTNNLILFFSLVGISLILYLIFRYFDQKNKGQMKRPTMWLMSQVMMIIIAILVVMLFLYLVVMHQVYNSMS